MKRANRFLFVLMLICSAICLLPPAPGGPGAGSVHAAELREAGSRTDFDLHSPTGGPVSLRSFVGRKPLVLVFWATWCPICRSEVSTLNRLNSNPAIQVLAIDIGESSKKVQSFIKSFKVAYPVVLDPDEKTTAAYQVPGIPACIILDKAGRVVYRGSTVPERIETYLEKQ